MSWATSRAREYVAWRVFDYLCDQRFGPRQEDPSLKNTKGSRSGQHGGMFPGSSGARTCSFTVTPLDEVASFVESELTRGCTSVQALVEENTLFKRISAVLDEDCRPAIEQYIIEHKSLVGWTWIDEGTTWKVHSIAQDAETKQQIGYYFYNGRRAC